MWLLDPLGRFLFVGSETAPAIWAFQTRLDRSVNTDNGITALDRIHLRQALRIFSRWMLLAKFLYAGQISPSLGVGGSAILIVTTGALTPMTGSPFTGVSVAQIHASLDY